MNDLGNAGGRVLTSILFAVAALCFVLPFVTAGCENRTTARGIDFVSGREPETYDESGAPTAPEQASDDEDVAEVLVREGGPSATLALAFILGATLLALVPGIAGGAAAVLAGGFALAALALFLLGLELRVEGVFADLRAGFWLAVGLTGAGTVLARRRWAAAGTRVDDPPRSASLLAWGAALLAVAIVVPHVAPGGGEGEDEPLPIPYFWLWGLSPGSRATGAWAAVAFVLLAFLAALTAVLHSRSETRVPAAGAAAGLGLAGVLLAVGGIGYLTALEGVFPGDGLWIQLGGGALVLAGGVAGTRMAAGRAATVPRAPHALAIAGAALAVVATVLPYDRGAEDGPERALFGFDVEATRWLAVAPLGLAIAAVVVALALGRPPAAGALLGLGAGLAVCFLPLLHAAIESEDYERVGTLGPAGIVGLAGAVLVVAAGGLALLRAKPRTEPSRE